MTSYIVGDIQGCLDPLKRLLEQVRFDTANDKLICTGDLVNRGPESLKTLRFLTSLGESVESVLGNHDLHLLAVYYGGQPVRTGDSLNRLLTAPDCEALCAWLRQRPMLIVEDDSQYLVTHAGVPHIWDRQTTLACAAELEAMLRSETAPDYLRMMYGNEPDQWRHDLTGMGRLRLITNYFTRMRILNQDGRLALDYTGDPENIPASYFPWFNSRHPSWQGYRFFFGHWAALRGHCPQPDVYALDTGCVWGGRMRLCCLDSNEFFEQPCPNYSQTIQHG